MKYKNLKLLQLLQLRHALDISNSLTNFILKSVNQI